ncbi:MAG: hypothetical protein JXO72_13470 [Vicinamibacteria bacterium]|nr:hypothetical protein [Vicinamibacteria bacterium]
MRRRRWILPLAASLLVATGTAFHLQRSPADDIRPHPFNQDRNAVWLEHRWLERPAPPEEMEALFRALARRGILYVYPHLIPFDEAGRLPAHDRGQMRAFLAAARGATPRVRVLPWVGGLRVGYRRTLKGALDLGDLRQRQRMVAECRGLMDEGFNGIHLNIEPVNDGSDEYLALLRALRPAMGRNGILSVSAIRPAPMALPFAPNFFWSTTFYRRVSALVDQIVVMGYDTGLPTAGLYRRYVSYVSAAATKTASDTPNARVLIGVPTYDARGLMHRAGVETLRNGLLGVISGLRGSRTGGTFEGVALYAGWTTDDAEWETYERLWRGERPPPASDGNAEASP